MTDEMTIKSLAPWFGAKRGLAYRLLKLIGPHNCDWEPMCGSAAVLLAKKPAAIETVNDSHGWITCLARTVASESRCRELYAHVARLIPCEALWERAREDILRIGLAPDYVHVLASASYLVASWLARNGHGGTEDWASSFAARYSATGGSTAKRWASVVDSIPAWHERLKGVTILNRDAFDVIPRIDDATGTAIYVDPPYLEEGYRYKYSFSTVQHSVLAAMLGRFKLARVVVSYYEHPLLDDLYKGWTKIAIPVSKHLQNEGFRDKESVAAKAPEIAFVNCEIEANPYPLFLE